MHHRGTPHVPPYGSVVEIFASSQYTDSRPRVLTETHLNTTSSANHLPALTDTAFMFEQCHLQYRSRLWWCFRRPDIKIRKKTSYKKKCASNNIVLFFIFLNAVSFNFITCTLITATPRDSAYNTDVILRDYISRRPIEAARARAHTHTAVIVCARA